MSTVPDALDTATKNDTRIIIDGHSEVAKKKESRRKITPGLRQVIRLPTDIDERRAAPRRAAAVRGSFLRRSFEFQKSAKLLFIRIIPPPFALSFLDRDEKCAAI